MQGEDSEEVMPSVQGRDSEEVMRAMQAVDSEDVMPAIQWVVSEGMPSNLRSDERLQFHAAGKRPEVQVGDSVEGMEIQSNCVSDEGPQLHTAGQRPEDAVMISEMMQNLMGLESELEDPRARLEYELGKQPKNQEIQPQKVFQILMHNIPPATKNEILAKLLKHEENQPLKQENQPEKHENQQQKQSKKQSRKSRMTLRKIATEKVELLDDKEAADLARERERELEEELEASKDWHAYQARQLRDSWSKSSAVRRGHTYDTITSIPPMRFTDCEYRSASPCETLQIFSVKVVGTKKGVDWPLYVYGKLAVRDTVDRKRNVIFDRERENFQTITKQDPYLTLIGPSRAAVLSVHHSYIEAELKIKDSSSDSDDKDFSYLANGYIKVAPCKSFITKDVLFSRLSTLELTAGHIVNSVEATVSVEVSSGKWPSGYGGVCTVSTASMHNMKIVLLSFGDDGLPLEDDGRKVRLSRRVVGVEVDGALYVEVKALLPSGSNKDELSDEQFFTPKVSSRSHLDLKVGSCEMKVSVAWSLLLTYD